MAIKDFANSENTDLEGKEGHRLNEIKPAAKKNADSMAIKNAHASGDGSFGRNDESLPDEEEVNSGSGTDSNY